MIAGLVTLSLMRGYVLIVALFFVALALGAWATTNAVPPVAPAAEEEEEADDGIAVEDTAEEALPPPVATPAPVSAPAATTENERLLAELNATYAKRTHDCDASLGVLVKAIKDLAVHRFHGQLHTRATSVVIRVSIAVATCGFFRDQIGLATARLCDAATYDYHVTCDPSDVSYPPNKPKANATLEEIGFPMRISLRTPETAAATSTPCACSFPVTLATQDEWGTLDSSDPLVGTPNYGRERQKKTAPAAPSPPTKMTKKKKKAETQ